MEAIKSESNKILSGKLNEGMLEILLKKAHDNRLTGKLSIKAREGFGIIMFNEGRIVSISNPLLKDMLGDRLVNEGIIGEKELELALEMKEKDLKRHLGAILVEKGNISKEILFQKLKEINEEALFTMFFWDGVYRFEKLTPPDIPSELCINVDEFIEKSSASIEDFDFEVEIPSPYTEPERDSDYIAEINDTMTDVAKSLTTFRPREIVIIVEDELLFRKILSDGLTNFGFEVEEYDNPKDAMNRIHELDMDRISPAIVLDIMMTGLYDDKGIHGGMDLLNYISRNYPSIPVIITTGANDTEIKLGTCFLGASYFLSKPTKTENEGEPFRSSIDQFIEELSFSLENIFRKQQAYLEKEQLISVREELLIQFLKKGVIPFKDEADIFRAKILFVDDENEICKLGEEFLKDEGFKNVDTANDGKEAIECFSEKRHDVVITDIVMPKKNGLEILKYVKTISPNSQVLVITGYANKNSAVAAVRLGAFDYIEKPINFEMLPKTIRRAVELKFVFDEKL